MQIETQANVVQKIARKMVRTGCTADYEFSDYRDEVMRATGLPAGEAWDALEEAQSLEFICDGYAGDD